MNSSFSKDRVKCCNFLKRHKWSVYKTNTNRFYVLGELAASLQLKYKNKIFNSSDSVCRHCYDILKSKIDNDDSDDNLFANESNEQSGTKLK